MIGDASRKYTFIKELSRYGNGVSTMRPFPEIFYKEKIFVLPTDMGNTVASDLGVRAVILCRVPNVESRKLVSYIGSGPEGWGPGR